MTRSRRAVSWAWACYVCVIFNWMRFLDPATNMSILFNEIKVQGFIVTSFAKDWPEAFTEIQKLINDVSS